MTSDAPSPEPAPRRSPGTWIIIFAVWTIGLVIWAGYLVMIGWLLYKILA